MEPITSNEQAAAPSRPWLRRWRGIAVATGAALAAGAAVGTAALPTLAYIGQQHNETLVRRVRPGA